MNAPLIQRYRDFTPRIDPTAFVHAAAVLIGEVSVGARASIWPGVVLRGDQGGVSIGAETNLQDGTIAHATGGLSSTIVGARVTVGHRVLLHGCIVEDDCLIGMGAILMDNCHIGTGSVIGAGAMVTKGKIIPPLSLVLGSPARVVKTLTQTESAEIISHGHQEYLRLAAEYLAAASQETQ
jgi:carbonic anhydrase/acetyltransferase-like protein (isoleucine patch superfamily)